uniref:Uncharacterized protein n=1 Tax=Dromaius novaehollandiae TaxID=8790 RepID=A0A8C4KJD9_DRONO
CSYYTHVFFFCLHSESVSSLSLTTLSNSNLLILIIHFQLIQLQVNVCLLILLHFISGITIVGETIAYTSDPKHQVAF